MTFLKAVIMSKAVSLHTLKHEARKSKSKLIHSLHSTKSSFVTSFQFKFQGYCLENECKVIPTVEAQEELKDAKLEKGVPLVVIVYKVGSKDEIDKIFYRSYELETGMITALEKCLKDNMKLSVLKLEFCNMTPEHIEALANILVEIATITEVSVSGNPNKQQNFHLLLKDTKLLILSLKYCSINHIGMEKISTELSKPFEGTLLHLNLASNLLFDEGIDHVVTFLRINRTLASLNLADNKIYDEGCLKLMQPLQKFPLELPEIIIRREIRFILFKKELETSASVTSTNESTDTSKIDNPLQTPVRTSSAKLSKSGSIKGSKRSLKDKASVGSRGSPLGSHKSSSIKEPEPDIGVHPFVQDSYEEEMEIYCKGNDTLINLGLTCEHKKQLSNKSTHLNSPTYFLDNRITKEGLNSINQMLYYQRNIHPNDRGISRISLEGNKFINDECEEELIEFDDLINRRSRRSSNISNKRSSIRKGSARPSVT